MNKNVAASKPSPIFRIERLFLSYLFPLNSVLTFTLNLGVRTKELFIPRYPSSTATELFKARPIETIKKTKNLPTKVINDFTFCVVLSL